MIVPQDSFARALLDPAVPVPEGLTNPGGRPATKRFDVYRNNVAVSLTEALQGAFPVLRKLLGDNNFRILAGAYLRAHPPSSPLLMFYGQKMPAFLARFAPTQSLGYLPDVARLELALRRAYHAADSAAISAEVLQSLPPEHLLACRLHLAPSVLLIRSRWPIHAIWRFNMEPGGPKPQAVAQDVLITRPEFDPVQTVLGPAAATFVAALMDRETFGTALERASTEAPDFDLPGLLGLLIGNKAIAALNPKDEDPQCTL